MTAGLIIRCRQDRKWSSSACVQPRVSPCFRLAFHSSLLLLLACRPSFAQTLQSAPSVIDVRRCAVAGNASCQSKIASWYVIQRDYPNAFAWYQKAASQGVAWAELAMGHLFAQGWGTAQDPGAAVRSYERAGANGADTALLYLALLSPLGSAQQIGQYSTKRLKELQSVSALASFVLARAEAHGCGVRAKDPSAALVDAFQALQKSSVHRESSKDVDRLVRNANRSDVSAQFALGRLYATGTGVATDYREAAKWLARAASNRALVTDEPHLQSPVTFDPRVNNRPVFTEKSQTAYGSTEALIWLGALDDLSPVQRRGTQSALKYYSKAANNGNLWAQYILAYAYATGCDAPHDPKRAAELLSYLRRMELVTGMPLDRAQSSDRFLGMPLIFR